ncbi:MAG: transposase [Nitrospirota bacterium]
MPDWVRVKCGDVMYARKVELCLLHFDRKCYDIDAFVLMPNHVHVLIKAAPRHDLATLLQPIKGVSANHSNQLLGRKSRFWMDESYDHIVPDATELTIFRNYIAANPVRAGLNADEYSLQLRNVLICE